MITLTKNAFRHAGQFLTALREGIAMKNHFGGVRTSADLKSRTDTWNELQSSKQPACCCKN